MKRLSVIVVLAIAVVGSVALYITKFKSRIPCPPGAQFREMNTDDTRQQFCQIPHPTQGFVREGPFSEWYNDKTLSMTERFLHPPLKMKMTFKDGKRHGEMIQWDRKGHPTLEANFADGQLHGHYATYRDGIKLLDATYSNGQLEGTYVLYYPNGKPRTEETFVKGIKTGPFKIYSAEGTLWESGLYKNSLKDGPTTIFHPNGKHAEDGTYDANKKHGVWVKFGPEGDNVSQMEFDHDAVKNQVLGWHSEKVPKKKLIFKDGRVVKSEEYFPNGKKKEEIYYEENKIISTVTYDESGKKLSGSAPKSAGTSKPAAKKKKSR